VLKRAGQTEASVDLARLAGLTPAAAICEIMNEDGTMARVPDLVEFAQRHQLRILTVAELISHRLRHETIVERVAAPALPTAYGDFTLHAFRAEATGEEHIALVMGEVASEEPVLVRVHSQCLTGDVFHRRAATVRSRPRAHCHRGRGRGRGHLLAPGGARHQVVQQAAPASSRMAATTRSRPTSGSASRPTSATTGSGPRSCAPWACAGCA
jgi:3,4-dihydroxy 2-butanone 4-phosphate synthase/GTP cyclohydrolase II